MFEFENVGKKITLLAKILGALLFVCGVAASFGLFIFSFPMSNPLLTTWLFFLALALSVLSYFVARLCIIFAYGFGELICTAKDTNEKISQLLAKDIFKTQEVSNEENLPTWKRLELAAQADKN